MATSQKTHLADLDPEGRAELLAELRAEQDAAKTDAQVTLELRAAARTEAFAKRMDSRDHLRDCPFADTATGGRFEAYAQTKPPQPEKAIPARPVTVVRCIECGGTCVLDEPFDTVSAQIEADLTITKEATPA